MSENGAVTEIAVQVEEAGTCKEEEAPPLSKNAQKRLRKQVHHATRRLSEVAQAEKEAGRDAFLEKRKEKVSRDVFVG